jgi:predicted Zn-ribbon and HTH transcriptional regulator
MTESLIGVRRLGDRSEEARRDESPGQALPSRVVDVQARDHDASLDTATYNCSCGFVFDADVNTTVACPHCGLGQAW